MPTDLERLPHLIQHARAVLDKATNAAEILDAKTQAAFIYDAAKAAARLHKMKDAHSTVIEACRKMQADALAIEARAQCRLADEYDAAQARGEVAKHGEVGRGRVSKRETLANADELGLSPKQVHEARQIRDAENAKPGIVRNVLAKQLQAGEEPTRAEVKRAVKQAISSPATNRRAGKRGQSTPKQDVAREIIREKLEANEPISPHKLQDEHGISHVTFDMAITAELARKQAIEEKTALDPSHLNKSSQEKLEAAIRAHKRKLDSEFEGRVRDDVSRRIDEVVLPHWKEKIERAQELYSRRRGLMDKATFNKIRRALHPDSRNSISDQLLAEAFDAFMALEKFLLDEKESPTELPSLPRTWDEWEKAKQAARAERRARRASGASSAVRPR